MERNNHSGSGSMSRSYTYVGRDSTENECSRVYGFLKDKSSLLIHERHGNLKYKYGNRSFWCRGYYVDTVGKNKAKIAEYIRDQLKEDQIHDQMTLREFVDPFTGSR